MKKLASESWHLRKGARLEEWSGATVVSVYENAALEYEFLRRTAGIVDLSFRSRLLVRGGDRVRFLHGQVTNDVKSLRPGNGCYAALISAKGKMQADMNIFCLPDALLLDSEPGMETPIQERLEKYVIADDVQIETVAEKYGLISVQGPKAGLVAAALEGFEAPPTIPFGIKEINHPVNGVFYVTNLSRFGGPVGYDFFAPLSMLEFLLERLTDGATRVGGGLVGCRACEAVRIENGVPRFGVDMDETNFPLEADLERRAISFNKGCYIGQEIISRIRTYGQVTKALRGLLLSPGAERLPQRGDRLLNGEQEVGYVTSALESPAANAKLALGYVRKECNHLGNYLQLQLENTRCDVQIVALPFDLNAKFVPISAQIAEKTI